MSFKILQNYKVAFQSVFARISEACAKNWRVKVATVKHLGWQNMQIPLIIQRDWQRPITIYEHLLARSNGCLLQYHCKQCWMQIQTVSLSLLMMRTIDWHCHLSHSHLYTRFNSTIVIALIIVSESISFQWVSSSMKELGNWLNEMILK